MVMQQDWRWRVCMVRPTRHCVACMVRESKHMLAFNEFAVSEAGLCATIAQCERRSRRIRRAGFAAIQIPCMFELRMISNPTRVKFAAFLLII